MSIASHRHPATERAALLAVAALAIFAPVILAHHSAAPHYDLEKSITLDATITKFELVNPHSYAYFTTPASDGKPTPWRCELASRLNLQRNGWTEGIFAPGQKLTIKGAPARREDHVCMLTSFAGTDGREVKRNEDFAKGVNPLARLADKNRSVARPARLANGRPNLSGLWLVVAGPGGRGYGEGPNRTEYVPGAAPCGNGGVDATPAGALAAKNYDPIYDNPALTCAAPNIFFALSMNNHVNEITQTNDSVVIKYGYMDLVRTVHLNTAGHPKNTKPSVAGHAVGTWEGDVLVVDTVGFAPGVLVQQSGLMHSAAMHAVERFSVDNLKGTLSRTYRGEDPLYLKSAYMGWDELKISDEPYAPYNCKELSGANNIRAKR
ncbi:MAG: hypothetical protein EXQ48_01845 [Acidobacteria bacterium]|nr:hypothetical protein [Acidobacteriota bacterium]